MEHECTGILDQQILDMIAAPTSVQENVGIYKITDSNHPAYKGRICKDHPAYGSFSRRRLPKNTVLGPYGGATKTDGDNVDGSAERAHCEFSLSVDGFFVDADMFCNELAFCNDYRTDIQHFDDKLKQEGYIPRSGGNKRHNTDSLIVWKEGDLFPRIFFYTLRVVQANEELMIDYGNSFWETERARESGQEQEVGGSQSSQVGLRRRNSLESPGLSIRTSSRLAEREFLQCELDEWKEQMSEQKRLFEEQKRLFEEKQRQLAAKVTEREKQLSLLGRQVQEKFPGHGTFYGTVVCKVGLCSAPKYKVRYTDGDSHERSEENIVKNLVDRNHEDQQAKQTISSIPPSSDEEDATGGSTQPFIDEQDWSIGFSDAPEKSSDAPEKSTAPEQQRSSPPAESVSGPAAADQHADQDLQRISI